MANAPVFIVACINMRLASAIYGERGEKLFGIQAVAAAIENMLLAADALGLGTAWVGSFSEAKISVLAGCPEYVRPAAVITVGWPAEKPPQPILQDIKEIVHLEKFGQTILHKDVTYRRAKATL
jgi:nitroreductase